VSVRKNITISDELNAWLVKYQKNHSLNPLNVSKVCQNALAKYLNKYDEEKK